MASFSITVPKDYPDTQRLDKYIASLPDGMNRSKLKSGITKLMINGKAGKLSQKVRAGDSIYIEWQDNIPDNIEPENIPLEILYEDENVTVVNKPQGMVTHPACSNWNGTLVNALLYHWGRQAIQQLKEGPESQILMRRRPGIVHRLDKETSGIIITARNRNSEEWLCNQFKTRKVRKEYILIVKGRPPEPAGDIQTQIIRDPKDRKKFKAVTDTQEGKFARTIYHCISSYGNYTLVRVRLKTGRTHQIRVHMKYLGCPIVGDGIYNKTDPLFPNETLMLHSKLLEIKLPDGTTKTFITPTPQRFLDLEKKLKNKYPKKEL